MAAVPGLAQPPCGTATIGKMVPPDVTGVCPGTQLSFTLASNTTDPSVFFFVQWAASPSDAFVSMSAPSFDPQNNAIQSPAMPGTSYYRIIGQCLYNGSLIVVSDTITVKVGMSGTYTINASLPQTETNFPSFTSAIEKLTSSCLVGPVVFDVTTSGYNYKEQLVIPEIKGASDINTITFNGNGNTVSYAGTGYYDSRYIIKLDGADHIIFDSLQVNATTGQSGFGFVLTNDADGNIIRKCTINAGQNNTFDGYSGIVVSGADNNTGWTNSYSDENLFENNTIIGGRYGISITGSGTHNQVLNNIIKDAYTAGVNLNTTTETIVAGNSISQPKRISLSVFSGILVESENTGLQITRNRIYNLSSANTGSTTYSYGIYFSGCDADISSPNIVTNNLMYGFKGAGQVIGLYNQSSDYAYYYHNTIFFDSTSTQASAQASAGFYMSTTATGVIFKNNIVDIQRSGAGNCYGIYKNTDAVTLTSDYNDIYMLPIASHFIGYAGSGQQTLSSWQTKTSSDLSSVLIDPFFLNAKEDNLKPNNIQLDNKGTAAGIGEDFDLAVRDATTPDVGAYEFTYLTCSNPPAASTVNIAQTAVCSAASALLTSSGGAVGDGLTYQWQYSADKNSWTDIAGGTAKQVTVAQTTDTWYRLVTYCGTGNTPSEAVQLTTKYKLSGNYTINKAVATGGRNFQSFNDAWSAVQCGITSSVIFDVVPGSGPYNEQLITTPVPGASPVNTITINGNGNMLFYISDNTNERAVVKLNGTDHLIIDSLVINAPGASASYYGFGIQLMNDADSNIIRRCTIYSDTTLTIYDHGYSGIVVNGMASGNPEWGEAFSDDNIFEDNTVVGGYYGISLAGNATKPNVRNIIRRNKFVNFLNAGIWTSNCINTLIDSNYISRPTRTSSSSVMGIYLNTGQISNIVTRNIITNPFGGSPDATDDFYGIYLNSADAYAGAENLISNNLIYNMTGSGSAYGLYNSGSDGVSFYHNTIHVDGSGNYDSYGFYQINTAGGIRIKDNIITISRKGDGNKYAMYYATRESGIASDYNNYFIASDATNASIGYRSALTRKSLADFQQGTNDANSASVDPVYTDVAAGNFKPQSGAIDNSGQPVSVLVDLAGAARDASHPDMGAYEFTAPPCVAPVAGTAVANSDEICEGNKLELNLTGNSTGGLQTYQWQASTTETGTYAPISNVQTKPNFITLPGTDAVFYRAAVTCKGTTVYTQPISIAVDAMLAAGVYTIDQEGTGDFKSFNEAYQALKCGIKGPVVFNVLPGGKAYNEQLIMDSIPGTSAVNTITFKCNGDTLAYSSSDYDNQAVITLQKTDYIIFDSLVINTIGTGYYGIGVNLKKSANYNTFRNSTILMPLNNSSSSYVGILVNGSTYYSSVSNDTYSDYNLFQNNTIIGGYCGISMMGGYNSANTGNKVIGNTIKDFYSTGVYLGCSMSTVIEGNVISRPNRTSVNTFYGIMVQGGGGASPIQNSHNLQISKNRIHTPFGGNPASTQGMYGIYLDRTSPYDYAPNTVSNNLIYNFNGKGAAYGIYYSYSGKTRFYHNTISLDNKDYTGSSLTEGMYMQLENGSGAEVKNNIITVLRGGTGKRYGIYAPNSYSFISDFNDIWVDAGTNKFTGFYGADRASLADWRAAANVDASSVSFDPAYEDTAAGKFASTLPALDNTGAPVGINTDINNVARNTSSPDLGAFEFNSAPCTAPPTPGVAVVTPATGTCMGAQAQLTLNGNSAGGGQKYVWQRASAADGTWTTISDTSASGFYNYELVSKDAWFRAVVVCGTGVAYSQPVQLSINQGLLAGDYTIDPALPAGNKNFQSFGEAIAAMSCGIEGAVRFLVTPGTYTERVRVPKIPGTSATATVTFLSKDNVAATTIVTAATTSDTNYVVKLDTANYIIFKNMSIKPDGTDYARAVEFTGTSSYDSITGCIIDLPVTRNTSENVVGVYGKDLYGVENVITKNTITNGMAGVYLFGVERYAQKFVIDSNTVNNSYNANIFAQNINYVSISGNTINKDGIQNVRSYGIWMQKCDSAYKVDKNKITITNTASSTSAIIVFVSAGGSNRGSVSGNIILADSTNTGSVTGLNPYTNASSFSAMNNVIVIGTKGNEAYGINSQGAGDGCAYYNNSIQIESATENSAAAAFSPGAFAYNNIFSNIGGGGAALKMYNAVTGGIDYNLLYSEGATLVWYNGNNLVSLEQWQNAGNVDYSSLVYKPVFADKKLLTPDVANANVWAMHGRGVQVPESKKDINGIARPVTMETGVPDMGAYEFTPTVAPVLLTATPAVPQANSQQVFMLGTDTVTIINWGSTVPSKIEGKRYSGVAPEGLAANQPFMYFYTAFTTTGTAPTGHAVKQYYVNSWRGTIEKETTIKLGKTNAAVWEISSKSKLDTIGNSIADTGLAVLAKFTGLTDGKEAPTDPIVKTPRDTSSRGTMFWAPYANTVLFTMGNTQDMVFYLGAGSKTAHVTIKINGTQWSKTYTVPANTAITSDLMPKAGQFDARLLKEGLYDRGISIESDEAISAYAHIYGPSASAATMLLPVGTYGYEYYALTPRQTYNPGNVNASVVEVIAAYDSTVVEITPSVPTQGHVANVPFRVTLKKGQVYQIIGAIDDGMEVSYDLTGTKIRSVQNDNGKCWPVAVFSGSNLTGFDCSMFSTSGTGDNVLQQNFPYQAWGKKYLTAPSSHYTDAKRLLTNVFRIYVKDPNTLVELNGSLLSGLVSNRYYEFASSTADYIKSDKPVLVAQFQPSTHSCGVTDSMGDPEMFFISPIEQGVKEAQLYRNTTSAILVQYLTLIVPTKGLSSLTIDGANTWDYAYAHPNLPGYTVVVVRWTASKGQSIVKCDSSFTGVTYGMGAYESYGYNAGTMVLNLNTKVNLSNSYSPGGGYNDYTCAGTPFKLSLMTTVQPTAIDWKLSTVPQLSPNADVHTEFPKATDTIVINGITYYQYALDQQYVLNAPGDYVITAYISHPDIDACDSKQETLVPIKVAAAPLVDFVFDGTCLGSETQFGGSAQTVNNASIINWKWDFNDAGAAAYTKDTVHTYKTAATYQVRLDVIDANGCLGDTTKPVAINAPLPAPVVKAGAITSYTITFVWAAVPGATGYEVSIDNGTTWIAPSGSDGLSHTVTGLSLGETVTIKVRVLGSCVPAISTAVSATTMVQEVFIPNSFTPDNNGPAENEYFKIYGNSIQQLRLMIFNQWGEKVFETNDKNTGWNGTYKGKPQPSGVYIYVADILLDNGKRETKKGTINLVR
ncbi:T9SS type B sorting domain-containing protein [Filimonas lacunae]|nr:gliding motility-associated C-terminal domain-containing protein [Filimonas lacunae]BAV08634.1 CHU large protein [Filimonas lacunae]